MAGRGIKIVGFKLGENAEEEGRRLLEVPDVILVLANKPDMMGSSAGEYVFLQKDHKEVVNGTKAEIAEKVWDVIA
jgi:phosphopantothenoylcysteine decarboxylase/phosphopantothenate--cysteine ligase